MWSSLPLPWYSFTRQDESTQSTQLSSPTNEKCGKTKKSLTLSVPGKTGTCDVNPRALLKKIWIHHNTFKKKFAFQSKPNCQDFYRSQHRTVKEKSFSFTTLVLFNTRTVYVWIGTDQKRLDQRTMVKGLESYKGIGAGLRYEWLAYDRGSIWEKDMWVPRLCSVIYLFLFIKTTSDKDNKLN